MPTGDRATAAKALAADVVCVVVFCTIGRRSHAEGLTVAGIAETAWPFLAGTGVGWLLSRAWRRPVALAPTGNAAGATWGAGLTLLHFSSFGGTGGI